MKIKLPKTPSYQSGFRIGVELICYESFKSSGGMVINEFVCMGSVCHALIGGISWHGHTEVWRGTHFGGDMDGAFLQAHVFFPHAMSETA